MWCASTPCSSLWSLDHTDSTGEDRGWGLTADYWFIYSLPGGAAVPQSPDDAIYFSVVTLASLGYGDFAPSGKRGQWYVVLHMATGVLLLILVLPLLVGRLATLRQDA